ncbi:CLN3_protein [Hexamita inflata]|uniref:CLN3 protein n=1 Tax=Hexamita inflata TaxID=28002 RepID=A0AA86UZZ5_9EUKA|nr:CLN3 protein [Hexamita inflata]
MEPQINKVCFIFFGFSNYFGFFLMLSAAKSMMKGVAATSTVLFCDITPQLIVKIVLPFIQDQIKDMVYIIILVALSTTGYILASFSYENMYLGLGGVVLTSAATGIGDVFLCGYSTRFSTKAIGLYMSGTGLASLFSSLLFALLVDVLNCNPKYVIYSFLALPFLLLECFMISSEFHSPGQQNESKVLGQTGYEVLSDNSMYTEQTPVESTNASIKDKLRALLKSSYLFTLTLLAITAQYAINQSINPVIEFPNTIWSGKYFTFSQVAGNLGAFLGKSSLSCFTCPRFLILLPASIVLLHFIFYSCEAVFHFINQFWLLLCFGVFYGFANGTTKTQSFFWVQIEQKEEHKKFAVSFITFISTFAAFIASLIGFWYEGFLESQKRW